VPQPRGPSPGQHRQNISQPADKVNAAFKTRDAPDIRPDDPAFSDIRYRYPAGYIISAYYTATDTDLVPHVYCSVADPDPGSGDFYLLDPR
jgi:hypothetical protein